MHHLIAPSSMIEVSRPQSDYRQRKGTRTHHPNVSRSRRDTPSLPNRQPPFRLGGRNWSSCPQAAIPHGFARSLKRGVDEEFLLHQPANAGSQLAARGSPHAGACSFTAAELGG